MNLIHHWVCRSGSWKRQLENHLLPWVLAESELGEDVLEVGPGPGLATDILMTRAKRLTSIEIDSALEAGIKLLNLESRAELRHVDAIAARRGVRAPIAFRATGEKLVRRTTGLRNPQLKCLLPR